jgi:uncharacterized membrane protein YbjE (DUF340 family)
LYSVVAAVVAISFLFAHNTTQHNTQHNTQHSCYLMMSSTSVFSLLATATAVGYCALVYQKTHSGGIVVELHWLAALLGVSLASYFATMRLIPIVKDSCLNAGLSGRDINKNSKTPVYV